MRMCYVYMKREPSPIVIRGYTKHKLNIFGFSIFFCEGYQYQIWTKDIEYFKIENTEGLKMVMPNE